MKYENTNVKKLKTPITPYPLPERLKFIFLNQSAYSKWLKQKAKPHLKRDNKRWDKNYTLTEVKAAIHKAVVESNDIDPYTGEPLQWQKKYLNNQSKLRDPNFKNMMRNLPTIDHKDPNSKKLDFEIVSWTVNSAKHDLTRDQFLELCKKVTSFCN